LKLAVKSKQKISTKETLKKEWMKYKRKMCQQKL